MTATLVKQPQFVVDFDEEEYVDDELSCVIRFRLLAGGPVINCPNVATFDAIVTCAMEHERTQLYCDDCNVRALNGGVDCRVCRGELGLPNASCPVTVVVSYPRRNK